MHLHLPRFFSIFPFFGSEGAPADVCIFALYPPFLLPQFKVFNSLADKSAQGSVCYVFF